MTKQIITIEIDADAPVSLVIDGKVYTGKPMPKARRTGRDKQ